MPNPSRKGTTAFAIHEALRRGGGLKTIRKNALRIFKETTLKTGTDKLKSKKLLKEQYLTEPALRKVIEDLRKNNNYDVVVRGKGDDIYIRVKDNPIGA